ncbi:Curved DNA-binding protein [Planctomycetes bacterium Pan216]|uniref:Curved DNA-binding protein n=1 Tax=Kolteria novifilia TaxID=2527975 RepID=A0A518AYI1_9BACT|nr:Curved DNA-binding protein [Planctomycetes bacterium Pan216]
MASDYYETLGVERSATEDEIKRAYRKLAREYHPDLHPGDKTAEGKFKKVQEAYDILGDTEKRNQYDRFGSAAFEPGAQQSGPGSWSYTWSQREGDPSVQDVDLGDFSDLFEGILGGRGQRGARGPYNVAGDDIETELTIPFDTAVRGGDLDITISGAGQDRLTVTIPPGVTDGSRLRLAGKGGKSPTGQGPPGDLYVLVRVDKHPYYTREGNDLFVEVPISISEAILGGSIDVPTLEGMTTITLPAGTSSGQKLRLRQKGGYTKSGQRGDLYARMKVVVPKNIDEESRRLIKEFGERNASNPRADRGW